MKIITFDISLLIKEYRLLSTFIYKAKTKTKEYLLHINFNPIAKKKQYPTIITIVKKLSEEVKDLEKNISSRKLEDKIDVVYKPIVDNLYYLMEIDKDYNEHKYTNGLTKATKVHTLQTEETKLYNIYEQNKTIIYDTITDPSSPQSIDFDYGDFVPLSYDKIKSYSNYSVSYHNLYLEKAIDIKVDIKNKKLYLYFNYDPDTKFTYIEIIFNNKTMYYYHEEGTPLQLQNVMSLDIDDTNKFYDNPTVIIKLKGFYKDKRVYKFDKTIRRTVIPFKTHIDSEISVKLDTKKSYPSTLLLKAIIPVQLGFQIENISIKLDTKKSYQSVGLLKSIIIKDRLSFSDNVVFSGETKKSYMSLTMLEVNNPI